MIKPSNRISSLSGHFFSELNQKLKQLNAAGADVIRLDAGTPDLPPAPHIQEALNRLLKDRTAFVIALPETRKHMDTNPITVPLHFAMPGQRLTSAHFRYHLILRLQCCL